MDTTLFDEPFTIAKLPQFGLSKSQFREQLRIRNVRVVLHGVYVGAGVPDTLMLRAKAISLVLPPFAVVCDRTAAFLYGIDTHSLHEHEFVAPVETAVTPGHTRLRRKGAVGRQRDLAARDIRCTRGIPATTELRTALDLGGALRRYESLACLDAFIRLGAFSREDLMAELARFNGRRGVVQLRELTALADGRSESTGESWSRLAVIDAGLPTPEPQIWVANEYGEQVYRLDLGYRLSKIAIEYDGERYHQTIEQRQRDKARRAWLRDHGWIVIVVRKEDLTREGRTRFISELREAVAARS